MVEQFRTEGGPAVREYCPHLTKLDCCRRAAAPACFPQSSARCCGSASSALQLTVRLEPLRVRKVNVVRSTQLPCSSRANSLLAMLRSLKKDAEGGPPQCKASIMQGHAGRAHMSPFACRRLHFRRLVFPWTDISMGNCSYLDTCRHMKTCRFVRPSPLQGHTSRLGCRVHGLGSRETQITPREDLPFVAPQPRARECKSLLFHLAWCIALLLSNPFES